MRRERSEKRKINGRKAGKKKKKRTIKGRGKRNRIIKKGRKKGRLKTTEGGSRRKDRRRGR